MNSLLFSIRQISYFIYLSTLFLIIEIYIIFALIFHDDNLSLIDI